MPEGDDSENRLTSRHLSCPDGRRYAATVYPTEKIINDKQPKSKWLVNNAQKLTVIKKIPNVLIIRHSAHSKLPDK